MTGTRCIRLVDIDAAGGIEPGRLMRSLNLTVRRVDRGRYEVSGGVEPHYVDLIDPAMERCDCADHLLRQVVCQHLIACLLREGDERVVNAVAGSVRRLAADNNRLRASLRGRTIVLTSALKRRTASAVGEPIHALEFQRDPDRESCDVDVVRVATGEVVGRITRAVTQPVFVAVNHPLPAESPRMAA